METRHTVEILRRMSEIAAEKLRRLVQLRPQFGVSLAAALLVLLLVQSAVAVPGVGPTVGESSAATFLGAIKQQVNLAYARAVRLVNDFRLVYEVHSQLQPRVSDGAAAPASSPAPSEPSRACTVSSRPGIT